MVQGGQTPFRDGEVETVLQGLKRAVVQRDCHATKGLTERLLKEKDGSEAPIPSFQGRS